MNYIKIAFCLLIFGFVACKDSPERPDAILDPSYEPAPIQGAPAAATPATGQTPPSTPEPAQNAEGVWHYTCSNGCAARSWFGSALCNLWINLGT